MADPPATAEEAAAWLLLADFDCLPLLVVGVVLVDVELVAIVVAEVAASTGLTI